MQLLLLVPLALTSGVCGLSSPSLSLAPANATVSMGITVKLGCVAIAAVNKCQWSLNNKLINSFEPSHEKDCSLLLKKVGREDSGHYRCAVTPKGSRALRIVSKKAFLKVIDKYENNEHLDQGSVFLVHAEQNLELTFAISNNNNSLVDCTWIRPPNTPELPPSTKSARSCEQRLSSEGTNISDWPGQWSLVVHIQSEEGSRSFQLNFTLSNLPLLRTNANENGVPGQILHSMWFLTAFLLFFTALLLLCLCCKRGRKGVKRSDIVASQSFVKNPIYKTSNLATNKVEDINELKSDDNKGSVDGGEQRYAYLTIVSEGLSKKLEMEESYEEVSRPEPPYENGEWNSKMNDVIEAFDSLERKLQSKTDEKHTKNEENDLN